MSLKVGLDIGIASVGWSVVDSEKGVLEAGSRLFDAADASKNEERRMNRSRRRLLRRKVHRGERFNRLWMQQGLSIPSIKKDSLLLRNKGIKEEISLEEIYVVLQYMLKHRGISYMDDAVDTNTSGQFQEALKNNAEQVEKRFPCEIQLRRFKTYQSYRGDQVVIEGQDEKALSNVFTTSSYKKELDRFFQIQKSFHDQIDDSFIEDYMAIFMSKRKYYVGPGNEKSRTDYGKYTTEIDPETGEYITEDNIFEKLIGKCSVYPDEVRASGSSYTAQEFNVLNDLNNLTVNGRKLYQEEKEEIIDTILNTKSLTYSVKKLKSLIEKIIDEPIQSIKGFRINSSGKELFHCFEIYKRMKKHLAAENKQIDNYSREELDLIAHILTINTEKESIYEGFKKADLNLSQEEVDSLVAFRYAKPSLFNKWHRLSLKAMNEMIPVLYEEAKNQMQILSEMDVFSVNAQSMNEGKYIKNSLITDNIFNPVVKKSVNQTIHILNKLLKKYEKFDDIIIEMARDDNEQEAKRRIQTAQKKYEKELEDIIKKVNSEYGVLITDDKFRHHKKLKTKLRLWEEQDRKCIYSNKPIPIDQLIDNPNLFEIDHIIPISISFDDSRNNKVLVYREANQKKGNRTPFGYFTGNHSQRTFAEYKAQVNQLFNNKKIPRRKQQNLLFMEDITRQEVLKGFINRNLNDTRYACRVVLNGIQNYVNAKEMDTRVKVIRGSFTNQLRYKLRLKKDREESFAHHAVDAMIMCYAHMGLKKYRRFLQEENIIDIETGETLGGKPIEELSEDIYASKLFYEQLQDIRVDILQAKNHVKYSHKVDKKANRQISNETIYGVRKKEGKHYKISKIKNIYDDADYKKFANKMSKGKEDQFLIYHHDPQSFAILKKVLETYSDQKNPFQAYVEEQGEMIRKYSKKGNGPFIKSLKYYDGEVKSHIDISHKYGHQPGSKKVVLDNLKPYRMDVYYHVEKQTYHFAGIKYADMKFIKGQYQLDLNSYEHILKEEKILKDHQSMDDLERLGYEFRLSFYKNDIIQYEKDGDYFMERFLSRTMPQQRNYIETKPINKSKFPKRHLVGLKKTKEITKVNTDILGNQHFSKKEGFSLEIKLD